MRVADIMTSPVIGIDPSASLSSAARLMLASHVSGLPVVNADKRLVGVVTEGDFLRRSELGTTVHRPRWLEFLIGDGKEAKEYVQSHGRKVEEVMSASPVTIAPQASVEELVELMTARKIKRVPVVDNGALVGIVSRSDIMRAVLRAMPQEEGAAGDDRQIANAIAGELAKYSWGGTIRVEVLHGMVKLTGTIFDERERDAARVAAENVAGVKGVSDELAWIEPMSGICIVPESPKRD